MCTVASGSWGGRCSGLAGYVTVMGATDGATAAGGCLKLPTLTPMCYVAPDGAGGALDLPSLVAYANS